MPQISKNSFQPTAGYRKVYWQGLASSRALLDFDLNELQDLQLQLVDLLAAQMADGATLLGTGGALSPGGGARQVNVAAGVAVHNGTVVRIPAVTDLAVFSGGTSTGTHSSAVYVDWIDEEITIAQDPTFLDATFGESTSRQKRTVTVGVNIGGTDVGTPAGGHVRFRLAVVTHNFDVNGTTILQSDIVEDPTALSGGELAGAGPVQRTVRLASNAATSLDGWIFDTKRTLSGGALARWRNFGTDLLTLLASGNLGIGITPTQKLHVSGNILATGSVTANGGLSVTGSATLQALSGTTGTFSGAVTAASFSGDGSSLTALNAANLASGSIPNARVPQGAVTQHQSALALAASQITSGTLAVARGGTGAGTLTGVVVGSGTAAFTALSPGGSGLFLRSTGAGTFAWQALQVADIGAHDLLGHTVSGLTAGHVLQATGATTYGFAALPSHTHAWSQITSTPTTRAGYGITDAAAATHTHVASDITPGTFGGSADYTFPKNVAVLGQVYSTYVDKGNVTGNVTINWDEGNEQRINVTGNTTLSFSNFRAGAACTLLVERTGSFTLTWPSSVRWPDSVTPTLSAVGRCDTYTFVQRGSLHLGIESGTNYTIA